MVSRELSMSLDRILIWNRDNVSQDREIQRSRKQLDTRTVLSKENHYIKPSLPPGVYFVEVVFENRVVRNKMVVN
jgi:hypothetical protein